MQDQDYEKALLVAACFQLAKSNDTDELVAVGCVVRNWVVSRMGEASVYRSYTEAISNFLTAYAPLRSLPEMSCPALIDPDVGMLRKVDGLYNNTLVDITSSHHHPRGARYFVRTASLTPGHWLEAEVVRHPDVHPLIGTWGSLQFFA